MSALYMLLQVSVVLSMDFDNRKIWLAKLGLMLFSEENACIGTRIHYGGVDYAKGKNRIIVMRNCFFVSGDCGGCTECSYDRR